MGIIFCLRLIPTPSIPSRDCRTHQNYLPCFLTPSKIHHPIPKIYLCFSSEYGLSQAPDFPWGLALGRWSPATLAHLQSLHLSPRPCPCASCSTQLRCLCPSHVALPRLSCSSSSFWIRTMSSVLLTFPPLEAQCRTYIWSCPCVLVACQFHREQGDSLRVWTQSLPSSSSST